MLCRSESSANETGETGSLLRPKTPPAISKKCTVRSIAVWVDNFYTSLVPTDRWNTLVKFTARVAQPRSFRCISHVMSGICGAATVALSPLRRVQKSSYRSLFPSGSPLIPKPHYPRRQFVFSVKSHQSSQRHLENVVGLGLR